MRLILRTNVIYEFTIKVCKLFVMIYQKMERTYFIVLLVHGFLLKENAGKENEEIIVICRPKRLIDQLRREVSMYHEGSCPITPYHEEIAPDACHHCQCWSDSNCDPYQKCCYNGCTNSCVESVIIHPAPVIDWIEEPPRQRTAGNAWLVPGPEEPMYVERCSTTRYSDGGEPLLCPTGYICFIENEWDIDMDMPNIGICIRA